MFKTTPPVQTDMFNAITSQLSGRKGVMLEDPTGWHNIFFREVVCRIDEQLFEPLFTDGGRPNAPIRVLIGMMVLKEGNGWSDQQLFESCRFDLRCMIALGLRNMGDDIPVESTYYELRRRMAEREREHGDDILGQAFASSTSGQIETYAISGEKIRMDSKLVQSNIAKAGRLELILGTLKQAMGMQGYRGPSQGLSPEELQLLTDLKTSTTSNITYPLSGEQKKLMLLSLGRIIKSILCNSENLDLLQRLYREQYEDPDDHPESGQKRPLPKKQADIPADSLQSTHDPQAAYRRKNNQRVSGYHTNLTETCSGENDFNLITHVATEPADVCEDQFLEPAIEGSCEVLSTRDNEGRPIKHVTTDGGYDSKKNRTDMEGRADIHWNMALHKGSRLRYRLEMEAGGGLKAFDAATGSGYTVKRSWKSGRYVIDHGDGTKRYMDEADVEHYVRLQRLQASQRPEDRDLRPNVEATVHQVFHRLLKRDKIKYRGRFKCHMYVLSRALWTNFRRITKNLQERMADNQKYPKYSPKIPIGILLGYLRTTMSWFERGGKSCEIDSITDYTIRFIAESDAKSW